MNRRLLTTRAAQLLLLLVVAAIGLTALLQSVVWGKEGFGLEDLGTAALWLAGLAVTALVWWAACRRVSPAAPTPLVGLGLVLLALPFAFFTELAGRTAVNGVRGERLAREVQLTRYHDTPLVPPGLGGPLGLRVEVTLTHPPFPEGNLFPPRLVLTGPDQETGDYFMLPFSPAGSWMIERPLMQPAAASERDRRVLAGAGPTTLVYDLYAAPVRAVSADWHVCLERASGVPDSGARPTRLDAAWVFHAPRGFQVRLGPALRRALDDSSRFAGRPDEWMAMTRRATADTLRVAGYTPCRSDSALLKEGSCWCPPARP